MQNTAPVWGAATPVVELPVLEGTAAAEVAVVGLGGSGLAALQLLREQGVRAVGLDAVGVAAGAAGRNGGFLLAGAAPFHHDLVAAIGRDRAVALYERTLAEMDRMTRETPGALRRTGSLRIAHNDEELADCAAQRDAMLRDGLPVEDYDGPAGRGLRFPADGALEPVDRCRMLAGRLLDTGCPLFGGARVTALEGRRVVTEGGEVRCTRVVVAVDGGLEQLLPELAGQVRTARAQMLATAPVPLRADLAQPVYARWGWDYWQQLPDGRVTLGGHRDRGGEAEWTADVRTSPVVQAGLEALLRDRLRVAGEVTHRWAGAIAFTPDRLPVLSEVRPGVFAAGAYSGTGNVVGALCGRAAAAAALGLPDPLWELIPRPR